MSQHQPTSLHSFRQLAHAHGQNAALKEAACTVDALRDELGRRRDVLATSIALLCLACFIVGAVCGAHLSALIVALP